jgi:hypothetical protein
LPGGLAVMAGESLRDEDFGKIWLESVLKRLQFQKYILLRERI